MFACLDCNKIFGAPKHYVESHGLDAPPYEEWDGCPNCSGAYAAAYQCDRCGEWIIDEYIKTKDGERYCGNCYRPMMLGDED